MSTDFYQKPNNQNFHQYIFTHCSYNLYFIKFYLQRTNQYILLSVRVQRSVPPCFCIIFMEWLSMSDVRELLRRIKRTHVQHHASINLFTQFLIIVGLNMVGRQRDITKHNSYQPQNFTAMECDPSPSRHQHKTYPPVVPYSFMVSDGMNQKHGVPQNGPNNSQAERDDSPMVGVCVQKSPVAIH